MSRPKFLLALAHVAVGAAHAGFSPAPEVRLVGVLLALVGAVWATLLATDVQHRPINRCGCPTCADHRDKVARGET